jgi:hypothetical protein
MIPPETSELILQVLKRFLAESLSDPMKLREAAVQLQALPLLNDMGGCYLIRPDGEIVSFAWGSPSDWAIERDSRIRNIALFEGSKKYPELRTLAPVRPPSARDCPHCKGTGVDPIAAEHGLSNVKCYCGGLGWIPEDDAAASGPR